MKGGLPHLGLSGSQQILAMKGVLQNVSHGLRLGGRLLRTQ
jgi:hypothetical protein